MHTLRNAFLAGAAVAAMAAMSLSASAVPLPGLTNLNFLSYTGVAPKASFTSVNPTGWTGGSGLIFIAKPGDSSNPNSACGGIYLSTYFCPSTLAIPGGYNYVEADGNPDYEGGFNYMITGLTPGETYSLSFYQAASQQRGFVGDTTNQWIVALGTAGVDKILTGTDGMGHNVYTYGSSDPTASIVTTPLMMVPSGGGVDWQYVSVNLTADASTQLLSFLAWGDGGSTINLPPIAFLAGVNSPPDLNTGVPEPGMLALFGGGLAAFGGLRLRRRSAKNSK